MKKPLLVTAVLPLAVFSLLHCSEGDKTPYTTGSGDPVDVTTRATPGGGKLPPADVGPVRSALGEPAIDTTTFTLSVTGLVDSPFTLTWEEILASPQTYSDTILMYCVEGWEVWGNWKGLMIGSLLEKAHVQPEGRSITFTCADGYTTALPVSYLLTYDIILAHEVNGKPLSVPDGFPLRLIAFGKYGYKWAKWITRLEVTSASEPGFWETRGYTDKADVPIERRRYYEGATVTPLKY